MQCVLMVKALTDSDLGLNNTNQGGVRIPGLAKSLTHGEAASNLGSTRLAWSAELPGLVKSSTWWASLGCKQEGWVLRGMPTVLQSHIETEFKESKSKYLILRKGKVVEVAASLPPVLAINTRLFVDIFRPGYEPSDGERDKELQVCSTSAC